MLYKETIDIKTLELLRSLQDEEKLQSFNLVGGTALALLMGHRKSIDLDLFSPSSFNAEVYSRLLQEKYGFYETYREADTLKGEIDGVKVDLIAYPYRNIGEAIHQEGVRIMPLEDIAAMKLSAIASNGTRLKDFIDIAFLSTRFSLNEMLDFYSTKYPNSNVSIPAKAITYFDDIEFGESIVMLKGKYNWRDISGRILQMCRMPYKRFPSEPLSVKQSTTIRHRR